MSVYKTFRNKCEYVHRIFFTFNLNSYENRKQKLTSAWNWMQAVGLERGSTKTIPFLTSRFEIFLNAKDAV